MIFKKATIIDCDYHQEKVNPWTIHQFITLVDEDGQEYSIDWGINSNSDFFGVGDKVSILVEDNRIIKMRLH